MKVVLLADVKKVGRKGEVVDVANGYAQSVLLPKKLALPGTPDNLKKAEKQVALKEDKKAFDEALLAKTLKELDGKTVTLSVKANDAGTLFEAVHEKQIIEAIKGQHSVAIPPQVFSLAGPIKHAGEHELTLQSGKVKAMLTLKID